jgi:hypothetical protein
MLAPLALLLAASKKAPRLASRVRSVGRVATYMGAMCALAATFTMHGAKAEIAENQISLGRDLAPLADLLKEETTILVNGERAHVATATSNDSLETVLDRFSTSCQANASSLTDAWKAVPEKTRAEARDAIAAAATTKQINGDEGTVSCIARGKNSRESFMDAATEFAKTRDFGAIGQLRYVYAKRGSDGKTFVLTAWTDDSFSMRALTPSAGQDAAGTDSALVPRPQNAQRILSVGVDKAPFAVRAYKSSEAPAAVLGFYDASLSKAGWSCVAPDGLASAARNCTKPGVEASIVARVEANGVTIVSLSEIRN